MPPQATIMSEATPNAGLAVIPELPSDPPQFVASTISLAGIGSRCTSFTSGSSSRTFRTPASTVFCVPPWSCIVNTGGAPGTAVAPPICTSCCSRSR